MSTTQFRAAATRHPQLYTALHAAAARVATTIARRYRRDAETAAEQVAALDAALQRTIAERDYWRSLALQHMENAGGTQ